MTATKVYGSGDFRCCDSATRITGRKTSARWKSCAASAKSHGVPCEADSGSSVRAEILEKLKVKLATQKRAEQKELGDAVLKTMLVGWSAGGPRLPDQRDRHERWTESLTLAMEAYDMERIDNFVYRLWARLVAGEKFDVPGWQVEHPEDRPDIFSQPGGTWPVGQSCDHVWRFDDGSRVHAQRMRVNGQSVIRLHRDKYDPDHSFEHFVLHGLTETPVGRCLARPRSCGRLALLVAAGPDGVAMSMRL
jgi:hypothetical protein